MANYKVPREVRVRDSLPATGAGKLLRRLLRDAD
jgi:long-chain acyl-CoA synthetase